ncbi:MAG TPA: class C sortase [Candidatus Mediterraneibacter stercoripullorum]|nr:class C sortase [Candidatus Mediterraneibacter stercoripullorum]
MKKLKLIFAILMFVTGLGIAGYPIISNLLYERNATQVVENYDETVEEMDQEEIDAAKEAAKNYNEQLQSAIIRDENGEGEGEGESYVDLTGVGESIGYITIPKIDAELPIYEGSSAEVLQKGVGHMEQSSYPVGGEGTHSVLTGHRGLPDAELFTRLDELETGDKFYLHVLDEILAYQVDQIKVVEPNETGDLDIIPGEDYCTLVTCTPYAINTHRLLVRGVRTAYNGELESGVQYQELQSGTIARRLLDVWPWLLAAGVIAIGTEAALLVLLIRRKKKRSREE